MSYNPFLGAGREPRTIGRIRNYDTGIVFANMNQFPQTVLLPAGTTLLGNNEKIIGVNISLSPDSAAVGPAQPNSRFTVQVDQALIASYTLPETNQWPSLVSEQIPFNYDTMNSRVTIQYGGSDPLISYGFFYRVQVFTVTI